VVDVDENLMRQALAVAQQALETGDVPVAALVLDEGGAIVSQACNTKERDHDPTAQGTNTHCLAWYTERLQ
jgi:tRNA(adenine34) deaminase